MIGEMPAVLRWSMELRHVKSFIAVAERLSFRSAAKDLYISQPALSKQVQQLEEEIGVPLFYRKRPHIVLTDAGTAFLDRARELIRASGFAVTEAKQVQAGLAGTVTIGYVAQSAFQTLPDVLKRFRSRVPEATFRIKDLSAPEQMRALADRTIDFALVQTAHQPAGLESVVLARERFAIVHSVKHRLASAPSATLKDFAEDVVFLPLQEDSADLREIILANFSRHGGTPGHVEEVERVQTAICLAAANLGVALIPESAKTMRMQGVRFRGMGRPFVPVETRAVWRRQDRSPLNRLLRSTLLDVSLMRAARSSTGA